MTTEPYQEKFERCHY